MDLIDRQAAIYFKVSHGIDEDGVLYVPYGEVKEYLEQLPSAQPERRYDEWCTDCKEYDQEKHCCPRWNRVIRTTLQEAQEDRKKGKWIVHIQRGNWNDEERRICPRCGKTFRNLEIANYCPNCGLPMETEVE